MTATVDQLIKLNNEKRKLLTEENEAYYTDLLVYIRTQWRLSEKQTEEVLMEMLDHLIEAQSDNKTAEDVFGDDPLQFAHDLIEEIANEQPRNWLKFLGGLSVMLLGWVLVIRAVVLFMLSFVTDVQIEINILKTVVISFGIAGFVISNIWFILREVKGDLFQTKKRSQLKPMMKTGSFAAMTMAMLLLIVKYFPTIGISIPFSARMSLIFGIIILSLYYGRKYWNKKKITE